MIALYHSGIILFSWLLHLASVFNPKARKLIQGRKDIPKVLDRIQPGEKIIWFHCASLGEFEQGRPLMEKIKKNYTDYKILLTFFSPSGYEIRKKYENADYITYLPFDTPRNARSFIKKVRPEKAIFVKYEFWYFFLRELLKQKVETYLISGMFREDQFFFAWYGKKFKKVLNCFNHFFVQDGSSYKILEEHGFGNITLSGDTRLDRVIDIVKNSRELPLVEQFTRNSQVLVAGSTWKKDEEILFRYFKEKDKPFKMIVAPHEVHASNIERIREELEDYSTLPYSEASDNTIQKADILIIDSIGLLASLYRYANLAYIGGGFGKGIHNLLEAATWGIPVIFGPNHQKFKEATGLIKKGGGFSIMDYNSLEEIFDQLLQQPEKLTEAGKKAEKYIRENAGATEQVIQNISL